VLFCAHCGFALPDGSGPGDECSSTGDQSFPTAEPSVPTGEKILTSEESSPAAAEGVAGDEEDLPTLTSGEATLAFDTLATGPSAPRAASSQPGARAVAVGLAALVTAAVLAIWLSYGPGSKSSGSGTRQAAASGAARSPAPPSRPQPRPHANARQLPPVSVKRHNAGHYSFAYPSKWRVLESERPVASYRETVVARADGASRVKIDYTPGETTQPADKALEVQAPTSTSGGYREIAFRPTSVRGRPAFLWEFEVAEPHPRRVDLFLRGRSGGFAILADGSELEGATSAARLIAGSLSGVD
jgi:hypothetical protein